MRQTDRCADDIFVMIYNNFIVCRTSFSSSIDCGQSENCVNSLSAVNGNTRSVSGQDQDLVITGQDLIITGSGHTKFRNKVRIWS